MSWAVGWDSTNYRWRGYGVPAFCDALDCMAEIDRGYGYACQDDEELDLDFFTCALHGFIDVDVHRLPPEHPEWLEHLRTDDSWAQWRSEHPGVIEGWAAEAQAALSSEAER